MKADEAIKAKPFDIRYEDLGEIAYNAAWSQAGGSLKPWAELPEQIQVAWLTVGVEVARVMVQRIKDATRQMAGLSGGVNGQIQ